MRYPLYLVDVFAEKKYAGNQLAVIRNAAGLAAETMQEIAGEMNYSETTFILTDDQRDGGYDVRIFSPAEELPFAGHPTLGTAYIIQQVIVRAEVPVIRLNLEVGQIPVSFSYSGGEPDELWMKQIAPTFGKTFEPGETAKALGIAAASVDSRFPVQEVSTGLPFIIVPLKDLQAVKNCLIDKAGYLNLVGRAEAKSILVFCPETYNPENRVNARMFDDYHGIAEDAATGSANGCLAAYLVKNRYFGSGKIDLRVEQGYEIGRPSLLLLKAWEEESGEIAVNVGGKVIMVARGELV